MAIFRSTRSYVRLTNMQQKKDATNDEFILALIKRIFVYPSLIGIGILIVLMLLYVGLLAISQYIT